MSAYPGSIIKATGGLKPGFGSVSLDRDYIPNKFLGDGLVAVLGPHPQNHYFSNLATLYGLWFSKLQSPGG